MNTHTLQRYISAFKFILVAFFVCVSALLVQVALAKTVVITTTGAGTWTVPDDWNSASNTIEVIGGGGGSARSQTSGSSGAGGGAYSMIEDAVLTPGASVSYSVGAAGTSATSYGVNGGVGGDTWFISTSHVLAKGGSGSAGTSGVSPAGGSASSGVGDLKYSGGNGGSVSSFGGGGGGGSGGPHGSGANGGNSTGIMAGGGGGGANGGYVGQSVSSTFGTGGNNRLGAGGGSAMGMDGSNGGGGAGGGNGGTFGGGGSQDVVWDSIYGPGSGGGGGAFVGTGGYATAGYGGGSGGPGQSGVRGQGGQGIIVITYADGLPPGAVALSPSDNATNISFDSNLVITFDEDVSAVGGKNIFIKKSSDDSTLETISTTDTNKVDVDGSVVTIDPSSTFEVPEVEYYIQIESGAFEDLSGNDYAGIADTSSWSFTTLGAQTGNVTLTTPGEYLYTIPEHTSITVHVYGGGGGGDAGNQNGGDGGHSAFDIAGANIIAGMGGTGANMFSMYDTTCVEYPYGTGGEASGGSVNLRGDDGGPLGGSSVQQDISPSCQDPAGWGGANNGPLGGAQADSISSGSVAGNGYGGGGSGLGLDAVVANGTARYSGGGGGGYASRTWSAGTFTPGSTVIVVVGSGGPGGTDAGSGVGGAGAPGAVIVSFQTEGEGEPEPQGRTIRLRGNMQLRGNIWFR